MDCHCQPEVQVEDLRSNGVEDLHSNGAEDGTSACMNSDNKINVASCSTVALKWRRPPHKVLLIKKRDDDSLTSHLREIAKYLISEFNIKPIIEPAVKEELPDFDALNEEHLPLSWRVPPVLAFFCGTLGFLTPFHIDNFKEEITRVVKGDAKLTLRTRLFCQLSRQPRDVKDVHEDSGSRLSDREEFHVLNEVVVDRGPSPYLTEVTCSCDGHQITTIRADGIIVSTTTGSTAYSLSAGAAMVCSQEEPVIFPNCVQLKFEVPKSSRNPAWVSFDGRFRKRLDPGECLTVETSQWVFPSIAKAGVNEWFKDIANILHWNDKPSH